MWVSMSALLSGALGALNLKSIIPIKMKGGIYKYRVFAFFLCINICRVLMKLFDNKARILIFKTSSKGLTSSEGLSKC